ncbi:hypothetical protein LR013_01785 [candidate division NPL-UPA2 bacterium]|nr:hypothetical protein [candidate division NPL-UPA2 bacterium]
MKTGRESCTRGESCSAPLCPLLSKTELEKYVWYPDEEVCRDEPPPAWIKRQRRIAKKVRDVEKYFTKDMLAHTCRITEALYGIDPNLPLSQEAREIKDWFTKRPKLSELSEMEKEKRRQKLIDTKKQYQDKFRHKLF